MGGSSYGAVFRVTTFGESHGPALGVVIDGCPAGIPLNEECIQKELNRRRPGCRPGTAAQPAADAALPAVESTAGIPAWSAAAAVLAESSNSFLNPAVTPRNENDGCEILSGVFEGRTTGAPIAVLIRNTSQRSQDYGAISRLFRPGHADYTWQAKYGIRDYRGGGRSSGRETAARTAAGAVARELLKAAGITITAYTLEAAGIKCASVDTSVIEKNMMRAPDAAAAARMEERIALLKKEGDSAGGIIECIISGVPAGLGEPVFDKLDAELAKAALSIGAVKGIEFGAGFRSAAMTGSLWNDGMRKKSGGAGSCPPCPQKMPCSGTSAPLSVMFESNHAGGILGGISSGADIVFRIAVKPVPSIAKTQKTVDIDGENTDITVEGRHDVCLCPRIVPVLEAAAAITLADLYLRQKTSLM